MDGRKMTEYLFKDGPLHFRIHAESDKDAVRKARVAIRETSPCYIEDPQIYLKIDLTGGAFDGRVYLEPGEITVKAICKRTPVTEAPF
jgi:hypothetical protein